MTKFFPISMLCLGMAMMTACNRPVSRAEPPQRATPKTVPTPHPATTARERAIQLYPDLAVKGSLFYRTFMEVQAYEQEHNPHNLLAVDWPIRLANHTATVLGVSAGPQPTPMVIYVTPKPANSLERGAYDLRRGVTKTPVYLP